MFTTPCFIRKNTPELRKKLEELGYEPNAYESFWEDNNRYIITTTDSQGYSYYTLCIKNSCLLKNKLIIDCGTNEDLFIALAALRDDTDKHQWFIDDNTSIWERSDDELPSRYMQMEGHKASVEEIMEHFTVEGGVVWQRIN